VRDRETIDSELRLLAAVRRSIREHGGEPSSRQVDELLDERGKLTGSRSCSAPVDELLDERRELGRKLPELTVFLPGLTISVKKAALLRSPGIA